ncbi:hypothetical protein [Nitrosopumilus sp. Nsub]|uniref:hypothetical protein n=1 Tax=Nitrosopumilus sp. Nsub TaxID=1776294 RepID=UPI00082F664B|nr:hypothetical protein [Nitrosopumilus sp. Nsub]
MHQCYYCDQIFDSKEDLYEHSEIHSDSERNNEIKDRQKKIKSKLGSKKKLLKKNRARVRINQI